MSLHNPVSRPAPPIYTFPSTYRGRLWRRLTRCWIIGHTPEPQQPKTYGPGFGPRDCVWCGLPIERDGPHGQLEWTARVRK